MDIIKNLLFRVWVFITIIKMSKTAIDFFSKGLDHNKTKLSVSVFDLNIKH